MERRGRARWDRVRVAIAAIAALSLAFTLAVVATAAAAPVNGPAPYGVNDAGGFRNVLPPGEAGVDNLLQLGLYRALGAVPAHFDDQQPLYTNLMYADPTLTDAQVSNYYKDATFGVPAGTEGSVESPIAGLTIVRDLQYAVPHVYGATRAETMFGAGYAAAEDRLFLMDVLRHTARAELSSFIGGSRSNRAMDETQWSVAPYTEQDLQSQVDMAPRLYGAPGAQLISDVRAFVAGINAEIAALTPLSTPGEYTAIFKTPRPWTVTDVIAEASLIGGIFGKGGGNELGSAQALQALEQRFGARSGRARLDRLPQRERPRGADDGAGSGLSLRDDEPLRLARARAPRPRIAELPLARHPHRSGSGRHDHRRGPVGWARRGIDAGAPRPRARLQLGACRGASFRDRPSARRDGTAGRLLRPGDPHGGGPPRPRHRRPRRRLPGGQPVRRAGARARLRVERHDLDLGQHRHVRRGSVHATPITTSTKADAWRWKSSSGRTRGRRTSTT